LFASVSLDLTQKYRFPVEDFEQVLNSKRKREVIRILPERTVEDIMVSI